jgi:hypothetical protein
MQTNLQHLRIEYLPIERLKPNPRNPRKHPGAKFVRCEAAPRSMASSHRYLSM